MLKASILSVSPGNGASAVPLDEPLVVRFNMAMDHGSVQQAFTPHASARSAALPGNYIWFENLSTSTRFLRKPAALRLREHAPRISPSYGICMRN